MGQCLRISGMVEFRSLYDGLRGYYAEATRPGDLQKIIGLYAKDEMYDALFTERDQVAHRRLVEIVGRASSCERLAEESAREAKVETEAARARGEIGDDVEIVRVSFGGYCHYRGGPVLMVSQFKMLGHAAELLIDEAARRDFTNLETVGVRWTYFDQVKALSETWFDAVRLRDTTTFAKLKPGFSGSDLNRRESSMYKLFVAGDSPVRFLFGLPATPPIHYFRFVPAPGEGDYYQLYLAFGCVCRIGDCTGHWPFSALNASLNQDLPYACIRISDQRDDIEGVSPEPPEIDDGL
jgi:hypothetical protein